MEAGNSQAVVAREVYGSSQLSRKYVRSTGGKIRVLRQADRFVSVSHFFRTVFLPQGYPESVSDDYLTYQIWDTIQAFASSITGSLAAQAVLKGVGVGDESATVLAATLTWLLKDGTGMLGRILFAWIQGSSLDCDAKRWRLFADILNDTAICLEILAPNFPSIFTFIVCVAGVLKSIVGVAGGATRAALTQHQARRNNMADVSAKDGSQETLVNLAALICNLMLIPIVTGKHTLIWTLYLLFTLLHLNANYSAVTCVIMESLNQSRLHIILQEYFKTFRILPTEVVNYREPVLWKTRRKLQINLGTSLQSISKSMEDMKPYAHKLPYLIALDLNEGVINIVLHSDSCLQDQLQGCYLAEMLNFVCTHRNNLGDSSQYELQNIASSMEQGNEGTTVALAYEFTQSTFPAFLESLHNNNWKTDVALLGADEWRAQWDFQHGLTDKKEF